MVGIEDYPDLDGLEEQLFEAFERTKEDLKIENPEIEDVIDNFRLDSIVVMGEWGRGTATKGEGELELTLYAEIEDYPTEFEEIIDQEDMFNELRDMLVPELMPNTEPSDQLLEWFPQPSVGMLRVDSYEGSLQVFINQAQPNRLFDLTRRAIVTVGPTGLRFDPVEEEREVEVEEVEGDILSYPEIEELLDRLNESFEESVQLELEDADNESRTVLNNIVIDRYIVVGRWGSGIAEKGASELQIIASMDLDGGDPSQVAVFNPVARTVANSMEQVISPSDTMAEWFSGISITGNSASFINQTIRSNVRSSETGRVVDITNSELIELEDGSLVTSRVTLVEEEEEVEEELPEIELLREEYPDLPVELLPYVTETERFGVSLEIPSGKETKNVQPRKPFPFEIELYTPGPSEQELSVDVSGGIGDAIASQRYGTEEPAGSFPRTSTYVKWFLYFEGPAYTLEIFNHMVVYSGFISTLHDGNFRTGSYDSFRQMMYRYRRFSEDEENPELVRAIPQAEAEERDLSTMPVLPTGEDAPWLEPRQYYEIVEDNVNHSAWNNITEELFGEA